MYKQVQNTCINVPKNVSLPRPCTNEPLQLLLVKVSPNLKAIVDKFEADNPDFIPKVNEKLSDNGVLYFCFVYLLLNNNRLSLIFQFI